MRFPHARFVWLLPLAALSAALSACVRSPDPAEGRIVIKYWEKWNGPEADAMRLIVSDFNAGQKRIYVDFSSVSQVERKFMLATAGGVPPDIAGIFSASVPVFAENNALTPLDKLAAAAGIERKDYIDVFWEICSHRGHLWALPSTPNTVALVWNKKLFREAGLDPEKPPRSISEVEEYNRKLVRYRANGRLDRIGFLPMEPDWYQTLWGAWFGGRFWDGNRTVTIDSPENRAAYQWVQSYPQRFGAENLLAFRDSLGKFASPQNPFLAGRVAMEMQGEWIHTFIQNYAQPGFEWGAAGIPTDDPVRLHDTCLVETDALVIPAGAAHPQEAFEFLRYVNSPKVMEKLCLAQFKYSPLRECSPGFLKNHPNPHIGVFLDLAKSPNARFVPRIATWTEFNSDMRNAVGKVWSGKQDAVAALAEVKASQQSTMDQRRIRWERSSDKLTAQWEGK